MTDIILIAILVVTIINWIEHSEIWHKLKKRMRKMGRSLRKNIKRLVKSWRKDV